MSNTEKMMVILDRNVFHNNAILQYSDKIIAAINDKKLCIIGNPILIEETIPHGLTNFKEMKKQIEFISTLSHANSYFELIEEIIRKELKSKSKNYPYWKTTFKKTSSIIKSLKHASPKRWLYFKDTIDTNKARRLKQKDYLKGLRKAGIDVIKELKKQKTYRGTKEEFFAGFLILKGQEYIEMFSSGSKYTLKDINEHPNDFPYCALFLKGIALSYYYFLYEHNHAPDPNGENDLAQAVMLCGIDAIVTNEKGFLPYLVDNLYGGQKKCFSLDEFIEKI